jgi:hypothetical protein
VVRDQLAQCRFRAPAGPISASHGPPMIDEVNRPG